MTCSAGSLVASLCRVKVLCGVCHASLLLDPEQVEYPCCNYGRQDRYHGRIQELVAPATLGRLATSVCLLKRRSAITSFRCLFIVIAQPVVPDGSENNEQPTSDGQDQAHESRSLSHDVVPSRTTRLTGGSCWTAVNSKTPECGSGPVKPLPRYDQSSGLYPAPKEPVPNTNATTPVQSPQRTRSPARMSSPEQ